MRPMIVWRFMGNPPYSSCHLASCLALRHNAAGVLHADFVDVEPELAAAGVEVGDEGGGGGLNG